MYCKRLDPLEKFIWTWALSENSKTFTNVVPCPVCGTFERRTLNRVCIECVRRRAKRIRDGELDRREDLEDELLQLPGSARQARAMNKRFYYPGKKCPNGHRAKWSTARQECTHCYLPAWRW